MTWMSPPWPAPLSVCFVRYEHLDAFKVCHELTLRVHDVVQSLEERDPELAAQLWLAALWATGRIARGAGFRSRRMFALCLNRTLGALSEMGYHLNLALTMSLVSEQTHRSLESVRGRAVFYTIKLLTSLQTEPDSGTDAASA